MTVMLTAAFPTVAAAGEIYGRSPRAARPSARDGDLGEVRRHRVPGGQDRQDRKLPPRGQRSREVTLTVSQKGQSASSRSSPTTRAPRPTSCSKRRTASSARAASRRAMADEKKPKDFWDKVTVVLHPMGGLLTAIAVTFVGMKGLAGPGPAAVRRHQRPPLLGADEPPRRGASPACRKDMFVSDHLVVPPAVGGGPRRQGAQP